MNPPQRPTCCAVPVIPVWASVCSSHSPGSLVLVGLQATRHGAAVWQAATRGPLRPLQARPAPAQLLSVLARLQAYSSSSLVQRPCPQLAEAAQLPPLPPPPPTTPIACCAFLQAAGGGQAGCAWGHLCLPVLPSLAGPPCLERVGPAAAAPAAPVATGGVLCILPRACGAGALARPALVQQVGLRWQGCMFVAYRLHGHGSRPALPIH